MGDIKHNPILNGSTKKIVLGVTIMVGIITLISLILAGILMNNDTKDWKDFIAVKSIFGGVSLSGMASFRYFLRKFMDTRTSQEKDKHKLEKYKLKIQYKEEKMKWKFKQEEIMKKK